MKVLLANSTDWTISGGTGVAVKWLDDGLKRRGIDSRILCAIQQLPSMTTVVKPNPLPVKIVERAMKSVLAAFGLNECHRVVSSWLARRTRAYRDADLVHYHDIFGQLSYLSLPAWTRAKPGVLTVHDMWAYTGHCTYSYGCNRFKSGCGDCPHPDVDLRITRDATHVEWKLKDWAYARSNLTIIAPSAWQAAQVRQSILGRFPVHHIPNGVDTETYRPLDRENARVRLRVPAGKTVLLVSAIKLTERRKGADLLAAALRMLPASLKSQLVVMAFGGGSRRLLQDLGLSGIDLGYVDDDRAKAEIYNAADLYILPTRADNSPLVLYESMACATPVVSFRVGGVPELVRHGETGLLAEPEDTHGLRDAIVQLLEDEPLRQKLGEQGRRMIEQEYTMDHLLQRHIDLYRKVLSEWNDR